MILSLQDLRNLFAKHCACRPLDVARRSSDHGPDCVTEILADIQIVLRGDDGTVTSKRECYEAVKRCDRYAQGDYSALGTIH
jgi:hypothetical protein